MSEPEGSEAFVTPEATPVVLDVAGIGSRTIATIVDLLIQFVAFLAITTAGVAAGSGNETVTIVVVLVAVFVVVWGYFIVLEGLWNGRTPGKAVARIRVVRADGRPVTWIQVTVRNLLRIIDFLPFYYLLGGVLVVVSRRSQRLGDLAAGTVVVRDRAVRAPAVLPISSYALAASASLDTSAMSDREFALVRSFLERRTTLAEASRRSVAHELAGAIGPKVAGAARWTDDDESLLEAVAASYRGSSPLPTPSELPPPPGRPRVP
jgi:uncharacterized RDD family membrane protein YckC